MTEPGPTPEPPDYDGPVPHIPPAQLRSILRTPGQEPLCYERNPNIGRVCNLTMYHPGDHRCVLENGTYAYWPSEKAPGPIPDPDPQPTPPPPIEPPEPDPEIAPELAPTPPDLMPQSQSDLVPLPESETQPANA